MIAKVKWFCPKKGFGFLTTDDGKDIFVHYTEIQSEGFKTLAENDKVEFEIGEGKKGPSAMKVHKIA